MGGIVLDKTKAFKYKIEVLCEIKFEKFELFYIFRLTTIVFYLLSVASMILFTFTVQYNIWIVFGSAFLLGFFMTGYLPVGFEFAAELTHPEPESTSSGLLNLSAQVILTFSILNTYANSNYIYISRYSVLHLFIVRAV